MNPLLTRRQTLQSLAYSAVFGGSLLSLVGCGGGGGGHHGGGGSAIATGTSQIAVEIPSGLSIAAADLQGMTAYGTASIASGGFTAKVARDAPTLAIVAQKSTGKGILFGLVGPGRPGVTPLASATLLVALALGITGLPSASQFQALALLEADASVKSLADTIVARLTADPYALTDGDAALASAVQATVAAVGGAARVQAVSRAVSRADGTPQILINPSDAQGGAAVEHGNDADEIVPTNEARRPISAYTYLVGHVAADGTATSVSPAKRVDQQDIDATTSVLASVVSLGVRGANAPKVGKAVSLGISGDDVKTMYETVVLMANGSNEADPAFFSDPKYAGEVADWRDKLARLNLSATFGGVLFDLFNSILGAAGAAASVSGINAAEATIAAIEGAAGEGVLASARAGEFGKSAEFMLTYMKAGNTMLAQARYQVAALELVGESEAAASAAVAGATGTILAAFAAFALGAFTAASGAVSLVSLGGSYYDAVASPRGELWAETVVKPGVVISPPKADVRQGQSLGITAKVTAATGVTPTYDWSVSGTNVLLTDGNGASGATLTNSTSGVTLATTPSTPVDSVVTVTVTAKDKATGKVLGSATGAYTIKDRTPVVEAGQLIVVTGTYNSDPTRGFDGAGVIFTAVDGATSYYVEGTGGNDTAYFGTHPTFSVPKDQLYIDGNGKSYGHGVGLSGGSGPASTDGGASASAYYHARFDAFTWKVTAYF